MRVAHFSYHDASGGAARGLYALHRSLLDVGIDSHIVCAQRSRQDPRIHVVRPLSTTLSYVHSRFSRHSLPLVQSKPSAKFSLNLVGLPIARMIEKLAPDIIHLHWVGNGMVSPRQVVGISLPVVWTLRDMWPFTGGCHYDFGCAKHRADCGRCPILRSDWPFDASRLQLQIKSRYWNAADLHLVALSEWLARQATSSSLFRDHPIQVINPGIDLEQFRPVDGTIARDNLDLPHDALVVTFVALHPFEDTRKGLKLLIRSLHEILNENGEMTRRLRLLIVGGRAGDGAVSTSIPDFAVLRDRVDSDDVLRDVYSASDVVVAPSAQEAFGKVAIEAMACGTSVVAFTDSGFEDSINHMVNGLLVRERTPEALAHGISWLFEEEDRLKELAMGALTSARRSFSRQREAESYLNLYTQVLE